MFADWVWIKFLPRDIRRVSKHLKTTDSWLCRNLTNQFVLMTLNLSAHVWLFSSWSSSSWPFELIQSFVIARIRLGQTVDSKETSRWISAKLNNEIFQSWSWEDNVWSFEMTYDLFKNEFERLRIMLSISSDDEIIGVSGAKQISR